MEEDQGESPGLSQLMGAVWRGRKGARLVALAGPGMLLTASLIHLGIAIVVLVVALSRGLPFFEDTDYLVWLLLLPLLLLVTFWSSTNTLLLNFRGQEIRYINLLYLSAAGAMVFSLLIGLMGLVLHLPLGQDAGALVNVVLLMLGIGWTSLFQYRMWVNLLRVPRVSAAIFCLPLTVLVLGGSVYLWLLMYGMDKLSWDPYFYL